MKCWCCEASAPEIGEFPLPVCETCKESLHEFGDGPYVVPNRPAVTRPTVLEVSLERGCRFEVDEGVLRIENAGGIQFIHG